MRESIFETYVSKILPLAVKHQKERKTLRSIIFTLTSSKIGCISAILKFKAT